MKKLKSNENMGEIVKAHGYELDAEERYVINIERELSEQSALNCQDICYNSRNTLLPFDPDF